MPKRPTYNAARSGLGVAPYHTRNWRGTGAIDNQGGRYVDLGWVHSYAAICGEHYLYTGVRFLRKYIRLLERGGRVFDATVVYEPDHGWLVVTRTVREILEHRTYYGRRLQMDIS